MLKQVKKYIAGLANTDKYGVGAKKIESYNASAGHKYSITNSPVVLRALGRHV
jgi:hypothetical protein